MRAIEETSMPSFDIVSKIEMTSVDNALQGVIKEMNVRYAVSYTHLTLPTICSV